MGVFVEREHPPLVLSLLDTLFSVLLSDESGRLFVSAVDAEEELNHRFREHGVGYRIEAFKVVRIGSDHLHDEVVKPAAAVLHEPHFAGADAEYKKALDHYRHGRYEDTITECHKALESTLKVICDRRGWLPDPEKATASQLIDIAFSEGLVPPYLQSEFAALRTVLGSGVPTVETPRSCGCLSDAGRPRQAHRPSSTSQGPLRLARASRQGRANASTFVCDGVHEPRDNATSAPGDATAGGARATATAVLRTTPECGGPDQGRGAGCPHTTNTRTALRVGREPG